MQEVICGLRKKYNNMQEQICDIRKIIFQYNHLQINCVLRNIYHWGLIAQYANDINKYVNGVKFSQYANDINKYVNGVKFSQYANDMKFYNHNYANGVKYISLGQCPRFNNSHSPHAESVQQINDNKINKTIK